MSAEWQAVACSASVSGALISWSALMERSSQMISSMIGRHLQIISVWSVGVGRWSEARSAVMSAIGGAISQLSTNDISANYPNADQSDNYPRFAAPALSPLIRHQLIIETLNSQQIEIKALRFSIIHTTCVCLPIIGPTTSYLDNVLFISFNDE